MNKKKLLRLGKISQFISQIFRYTVILILLTIAGVGTAGIAGVLGVMYFKFVQTIIPFKTSIHQEFLAVMQQKIELEVLREHFKKKLFYNIWILGVLLLITFLILSEVRNPQDQIIFSVLFGTFISLSFFQFYYFKTVNNFIQLMPKNANDKSLIQNS